MRRPCGACPHRSPSRGEPKESEIAIIGRPDEAITAEDGVVIEGETRWPMALAVLALMAFALASPPHLSFLPGWVLAAVEGILLLVLIVGDPGRIDRDVRWLRWASVTLVAILILSTLATTTLLIYDLLIGSTATSEPAVLILAGVKVWLGNNVAFALLYWELDGGGPARRLRGLPAHPDLAFPQQLNPELARSGWRPHFIDYLYVAFTNANAFSPTDTMPMVPWTKVAMASQALISFAIIGLVFARAVNAFT
jgi:hypothetical protein